MPNGGIFWNYIVLAVIHKGEKRVGCMTQKCITRISY